MKTVSKSGLKDFLTHHPHTRGIIVCPDKKFIYMKATKTAGTSILRGLLEKEIPGIIHQKDHPDRFGNWLEGISDDLLQEYFIFSIIRNPWDRVVSIASYFDLPLGDFLSNFKDYCQDDSIRIHSLPLNLYTHQNGIRFADMICRFESLQPDINLVLDRIGLERQKLPFLNRSDHQHYSTYYSPEDIEKVADFYQDDILLFGYMFEEAPGSISGQKGWLEQLFRKPK